MYTSSLVTIFAFGYRICLVWNQTAVCNMCEDIILSCHKHFDVYFRWFSMKRENRVVAKAKLMRLCAMFVV